MPANSFRQLKNSLHPGTFVKVGEIIVPTIVLLFLYWSTLVFLVSSWEKKQEYGYCFLIPLVVGYLIWKQRKLLASIPSAASWQGIWILLGGVFLYWLGSLAGEYFTLYLSLWFVVVGMVWMALGWGKLKAMAFPLLFSLTMFPPPVYIHNFVTLKLQLVSSRLGVGLIKSFGIPAYREGNLIDLGFTQLQVVEACSGLNSAISLGVMGILIAYLYKAAKWKRGVIVVSTIPLAIAMNGLRIALSGLIAKYWGVEYAQGFFHDFSGWLMFVLVLPILYLEIFALDKLTGVPTVITTAWEGSPRTASTEAEEKRNGSPIDRLQDRNPDKLRLVRIGAATLVLLLAIGMPDMEAQNKIPPVKPFNQFPSRIGIWTGQRQVMDAFLIDTLDLTDYALIDYRDSGQNVVNFYSAYYASQSKGESIHSPATCYPGSGWNFDKVRTEIIPLGKDKNSAIRVNAVLMEKDGQKQLMYYWFVLRGRIVTNYFLVKWFNFLDMALHNRADGALVRLVTPVSNSEKIADTEDRLTKFTGLIVPVLEEFIPD